MGSIDRRAAVLRDLLRQSGWKVAAEVADAALAQLGIPRSTLFGAVARFRRTRRASSLLPLKRGTRDGSLLLDPRIERIIEEQIERFWLKKEKPRFSALMERVHDACHVEGLRAPHRKTIKRRVLDLNPLAAARRRGQGVLETASTPSPGQFVADRPNAIWQIDHTIVDIVVVDEQYRRPIGRPVLTIAIDFSCGQRRSARHHPGDRGAFPDRRASAAWRTGCAISRQVPADPSLEFKARVSACYQRRRCDRTAVAPHPPTAPISCLARSPASTLLLSFVSHLICPSPILSSFSPPICSNFSSLTLPLYIIPNLFL